MKFKYMMRGFGIGVLFASLILAFSFYHKENSLSDAEIMARASKLGMVKAEDVKGMATDKQELSEQLAQEVAEKKEAAVSGAGIETEEVETEETETEDAESSATAGEEGEKKSGEKETGSDKEEESGSKAGKIKEGDSEEGKEKAGKMDAGEKGDEDSAFEKQEVSTARVVTDEEMVSIHVDPGMYSSQVTELLAKKGVVDDSADLDRFLCEKNYAMDIQIGDFLIPKGADYEQIAEILTRH